MLAQSLLSRVKKKATCKRFLETLFPILIYYIFCNFRLRILIVSDWGKVCDQYFCSFTRWLTAISLTQGGNTGTYISSFNFTKSSVTDESDSLEASSGNLSTAKNENEQSAGTGGGSLFQPQVAKAMGKYAAQSKPVPSFVLALGDNFYLNGVSSATDVLWNYLWKDVYGGYSGLNIPWYPILSLG